MKKTITLLVLVFAITLTTQAQKKEKKSPANKMLATMTTELGLTEAQQNKIQPLLVAQMADRKAQMEKRKALKEAGEQPSKEAMKSMRKERADKEAEMERKMKDILTEAQFTKFKEMVKNKRGKKKKNNN